MYLEIIERLVGGGINGKDHTSFAVARKKHQHQL